MKYSLAKTISLLVTFPALLSCQGDDRKSRSDRNQPGGMPGISSQDREGVESSGTGSQSSSETSGADQNSLPDMPGSTDGSGDPDKKVGDECGEHFFQAKSLPPNVMLVLDKSGSMYFQSWLDGAETKRRWASLHAVTETLLRRLDGRFNFGLKLFPALGAQESKDKTIACRLEPGVEVECGPNQADKILQVMPGADAEVYGDTPTVSGLDAAYKYLSTLSTPNPKAMVLIVDGETNCSETNQELATLAKQAFDANIPVYVVGIDLSSSVASGLSQTAVAGGTKKLYNTQDSGALISTLETILGEVVSCTIPFKIAPQYPDRVEVRSGSTLVPRIEGANSCAEASAAGKPHGWVFSDPSDSPKEITLCGDSCENYRKNPQLRVEFHCPPPL